MTPPNLTLPLVAPPGDLPPRALTTALATRPGKAMWLARVVPVPQVEVVGAASVGLSPACLTSVWGDPPEISAAAMATLPGIASSGLTVIVVAGAGA